MSSPVQQGPYRKKGSSNTVPWTLSIAALLLIFMYVFWLPAHPTVATAVHMTAGGAATGQQQQQPQKQQQQQQQHRRFAQPHRVRVGIAAVRQPEQPGQQQGATAQDQRDTAALKQLLLSLNFTSARAAALMDAAGPSTPQQLQDMMRQYQALYCRAGLDKEPLEGAQAVPMNQGGGALWVYSNNDIVSQQIRVNGNWEAPESKQMAWALQQYRPKGQGDPGPLALDVGANVGWFMAAAAQQGARVLAFEAMPENQALLRRSVCSSPEFQKRITLFATGLGSTPRDCFIVAHNINKGDGHTVCDKDPGPVMAKMAASVGHGKYEVRGIMSIRRLDDLISADTEVQVLKIDVEGFEEDVLNGADKLLSSGRVKYLLTECNLGLIGQERQNQYIRYLHSKGFIISNEGFQGPFLSADQLTGGGNINIKNMNLFCVHKTAGQQ